MKAKFYIIDWAGNDKTSYYGEFDSFEDAWGRLYEEFQHLEGKDYDDQLSEFYVTQRGTNI